MDAWCCPNGKRKGGDEESRNVPCLVATVGTNGDVCRNRVNIWMELGRRTEDRQRCSGNGLMER